MKIIMEEGARDKKYLYSRNDIGKMLFADNFARNTMSPTLVPYSEIRKLGERIRSKEQYSELFNKDEVLMVSGRYNNSDIRALVYNPVEILRRSFVFIDNIIHRFPGKLIVAGGSIFKACTRICYNDMVPGDADIFFINCTTDEVKEIIAYAWNLIKNPRRYGDALLNEVGDDYACCIHRTQNTTSLYYDFHEGFSPEMLPDLCNNYIQFIHRIYPSKEAVIRGFDLSPAMAFYDGTDIYATRLGAWSIATRTIILDPSRRSTSYEYRIVKYINEYSCGLVIPNGSSTELYREQDMNDDLSHRYCRYFQPITNMKILSTHTPIAYKLYDDTIDDDCFDYIQRTKYTNSKVLELVGDDHPNYDKIEELLNSETNGKVKYPLDNGKIPGEFKERDVNFSVCCFQSGGISDYDGGECDKNNLEKANAIFAARGNIDAIIWTSIEQPDIKYDIPHEFRSHITEKARDTKYHTPQHLRRWFGYELAEKMMQGYTLDYNYIEVNRGLFHKSCLELCARIKENIRIAREKADTGITIMIENPGRQWTSSYNPVVSDVRDYYHPSLLDGTVGTGPLIIGIPNDIYITLRAGHLDKGSTLSSLSRDTFKLIMTALAKTIAQEGDVILMDRRIKC